MTDSKQTTRVRHLRNDRPWRLILSSLAAGSAALLSAQATGARAHTSVLCALGAAIATGVAVTMSPKSICIIDSEGPRWLSGDEVQEAIVSAHAFEASNYDLILAIRANREYIAGLQEEIERLQARAKSAPCEARYNGDSARL